MSVIANTTVISNFAGTDQLDLLRELVDVLVPLLPYLLEAGKKAGEEAVTCRLGSLPGDQVGEIVSQLVKAGLIERYWMTLKIASEVMADHILISHFFNRETMRSDYQRQIIEPFFPWRPFLFPVSGSCSTNE
jgi:hypothetical protein